MARRDSREATAALTMLTRDGVRFVRHEYRHDPAASSYGLEAAQLLQVAPGRVLKTLVVDLGGELCVAAVPVDRSLDLKATAAAFGAKKVVLAEPERAERATGYVVGAISPVGQRRRLRTVVDETALQHETVFVSGGRRGLEVELSPRDLMRVSGAIVAAVAR